MKGDKLYMKQEVQFFTNDLNLINGSCEDINIRYKEALLINIRLDIIIEFTTYREIVKNGYFHLKYNDIPKGIAFDPNKFIRISLKPSLELFKSFTTFPNADAIREILFYSDQKDTLLHEMDWYILSVGQLVDLPEGEEGILEEGFDTIYGQENQDEELDRIEMDLHSFLDEFKDIESILDKYNIPYIREKEQIRGEVYFDEDRWSVFIYESNRVFLVCSVYHFFIDTSNYDKIMRKLLEINGELVVGSFDFDFSEGMITFRTSIDAGDEYLDMGYFERMLIGNIATAKAHYETLKEFS
jgi:hypothetical protein